MIYPHETRALRLVQAERQNSSSSVRRRTLHLVEAAILWTPYSEVEVLACDKHIALKVMRDVETILAQRWVNREEWLKNAYAYLGVNTWTHKIWTQAEADRKAKYVDKYPKDMLPYVNHEYNGQPQDPEISLLKILLLLRRIEDNSLEVLDELKFLCEHYGIDVNLEQIQDILHETQHEILHP